MEQEARLNADYIKNETNSSRRKELEVQEQIRKSKEKDLKQKLKEIRNQQKIRRLGVCSGGYEWSKCSGGYICASGSHFIADSALDKIP